MIDHLRLAIPLRREFCVELHAGAWTIAGSITDYGVSVASRSVEKQEDGSLEVNSLYSPYEQLPSSFTPMAFKFFHETHNKPPYIEIKASPAKLLQGHNVYGTDNLQTCAFQMLGLLWMSHRKLYGFLDIDNTEVMHIDCTYSSRAPQQELVPRILEFLKNVENGQTRANHDRTVGNTVYWGGSTSRLVQLKAYGKHTELTNSIKKLQRKSKDFPSAYKHVETMDFDKLLEYSKGLVRWEARIMKRKLERSAIPTNLFDLIIFQQNNPNLISELWQQNFKPIFKALEGLNMNYADDEAILKMLKLKLQTTTKSGRISFTKANNAFKFYQSIRLNGIEKMKQIESKPTFHRNIKALVDAGISKSALQNLHKEQNGKIIPFIRFIEVNFDNQHPADWVEPINHFSGMTEVLVA